MSKLDYEKSFQPNDLKKHLNEQLFVKNNSGENFSYYTLGNNPVSFRLKPYEMQPLPVEAANDIQFHKFWRAGKVSVFPESAALEEMSDQEARIQEALIREAEENPFKISAPETDKDLQQTTCLEKGCNESVFLSTLEKKQNTRPPLCSTHERLASGYVLSTNSEDGTNKWFSVSFPGQ